MWDEVCDGVFMRDYGRFMGIVNGIRWDTLESGGSFVLSTNDYRERTVAKGDFRSIEEAMEACDHAAGCRDEG